MSKYSFVELTEKDFSLFLKDYDDKNWMQSVGVAKLRQDYGSIIKYLGVKKGDKIVSASMFTVTTTFMGKKTFYFTSQPIMKELAKAYINAGALYMADPHKGKYKLQQEAIDEFAEKYFEELGEDAINKIRAIKEGGTKNAKLRSEINKDIADMF